MNTLILILCFTPIYKADPAESCFLAQTSESGITVQEYCDRRIAHSPNYRVTICREFDGSRHDKEFLR